MFPMCVSSWQCMSCAVRFRFSHPPRSCAPHSKRHARRAHVSSKNGGPLRKPTAGQADSGAAGLLLQSRSSPPLPTKCARIVAERASLAAPSWSPEYARLPLRCKPLCYFRCRQNSEAKGSRGSRTTGKLSSLATHVSSRDESAAVTETSFRKHHLGASAGY